MRTGLIIGEFDPPHNGHMALFKHASRKCNFLNIYVTDSDKNRSKRLKLEDRVAVISEEIGTFPEHECVITIIGEKVALPNSKHSCRSVSKMWADYLNRKFPNVTHIFSSEKYGDYLAEYMGIKSEIFDINRKAVPVSSTDIHDHPFRYWEHIPASARRFYVKKVCVYGAESTGKSRLTKFLAKEFDTTYVPEIARTIMEENGISLKELNDEHFLSFAQNQYFFIEKEIRKANKILFCDTDNIITQGYSKFYLKKLVDGISDYEIPYDLYLFLYPNVPFVQDGIRNSTDRRTEMHSIFVRELETRRNMGIDIRYRMINKHEWIERNEQAVKYVKELMES